MAEPLADCVDYRPWKDCNPGLRSWLCCFLALDDTTCEFGPGQHANKACPWQGRPRPEAEYDLFDQPPKTTA